VKCYLILVACGFSGAACLAQTRPPAVDLRTAIRQATSTSQPVAPRQLSDQERAELRRQLSLYSRMPVKGS
jgi:uncharacterized membrane protein